MNRVFRIIWSQAMNAWVVVSELATRRGKSSGGVDQRTCMPALVIDRDVVEGSPPTTAWLLRVGILLALLSPYTPADAANRYWDANGTAVGRGGTGTWESLFWSPSNDGVSGPYSAWNNAALDDAFFGGTAGTVTLGGPFTAHNLTFEVDAYTITGNTLTLGGVTPTITTSTGNATINSILAGNAGLTKAGGGTLFLNGANTFSGGINVNAGGLTVNGDASLGNASNGISMANGTILTSSAALNASRVVTLNSGTINVRGAGVGAVRYTGAGGLNVGSGIALSNNASNYTGQTVFGADGSFSFNSIADLGVASALGAPTTVANGTIYVDTAAFGASAIYTGAAASSNRNWQLVSRWYGSTGITNAGTGTLTLTGNISGAYANGTFSTPNVFFNAQNADMALTGVISGNPRYFNFTGGGTNRTITLGGANTYAPTAGTTGISNVTVKAGTLANTGVASSFGTSGSIGITNGVLSYTGAGASSDRAWGLNNGTINNDGTGALALSGALGLTNTGTLGGSYAGTDNLFTGVISGAGGLAKSGASTWVISGANTYTGSTTVNSGTLRAGSTTAFGATSGAVVNGGTLDLNDFNFTLPSLAGTGGTVDLGTGMLTLDAPAATNTSYAGNITGTGGLTKNGASTQTLTGANTYTGATTVNGGTLRLDFSPAGGPASNIIASASTLNMGGGTLNAIGAAGEANTQTFNGLNVTAGNNTIGATSGAGGSMTVNLGAITRTGGLVNFNLPGSGNITTTNTALGGWATVNGTDYAKVVGGNILAFTNADYVNKDNAATWLTGEFVSDAGGTANTPFTGTVAGTQQLGGLKYTAANNSTVTVGAGNTLGVDGTIIVATSVGGFNQTITGGSISGLSGGGALGVQQNGTGNFTIASQIVDNGGVTSFSKAGTGLVTLTNAGNSYTGATTVVQGTLSVGNIGNGGVASGIGASSAASSNLRLEGSTLRYTGGTTSSDRGFTIAKSGANLSSTIEVTAAATNLAFSGLVTSPDGAGLTKTGAGTLTLSNAGNDYTGITRVDGGTLAVNTLANGGLVSGIGASSNASANLVLNGGTLDYLGGTTSTDRGFTVGTPGAGGASGGIGVSNAATTLTMSGTVVGDDGLRKEGAGTLVLSGTNTYTGGTTVNAGTLRAGAAQAFGSTVNNLTVASGATVDLNGLNIGIGALFGSGNVTQGSGTLTSNVAGGTFSGVISGSGGYTQGGANYAVGQTMSGCNNTYTGATSLNGGAINVNCLANGGLASGIGASSNASSNLVFNTGILRYTGGNIAIDRGITAQSGPAAIDVANAATTLGISGTIVGGGFLRKDGAGTLVISGNNTYTGGTQVTGGILRAGSATAFGTGHLDMVNTAGATLDLNGFNTTFAWLQGGGTTGGNINLGAQTLTLSSGNNTAGIAYAGNINGSGNLVKNGAQLQRLSGCNSTYTGTTTINGGGVAVDCLTNGGSNSAIGASSSAASNLVINNGAYLQYTGAGHSSDRLFTLGAGGGQLDASGTGALNLTNSGAVALSGTNTARTLTITGTNTGNNTLSAQLDNNGTGVSSLTKTGTGTWILTNNNSSYTGITTISGGVLGVSQLANGGTASGIGASSSAASNLVIGNGSTLRYTGAGDSTDRLFTLASGVTFIESSGTGAINFTNTGTIGLANPNVARTIALGGTNTGNNTLAAVIGNAGTGITTLAKNDSGTWVLTGNNTYTGNTVINNGNLMIGNGGTSGNLGTGNVIVDSATSTLSMNRSDTVVFNATMSGPGAFAQVGNGTTTLTANNSIGATRVSAGTLDVNGALTTATLAMSGTSTLNVDGTVQAAGGTAAALTGDAGASTINVNGGATLRAYGDLGDGSDALTVAGTLDTGATALSLGAGDDTLTLNDGAVITGVGVDAGAGTADNLIVNNALAMTFGGTGVAGFEALTKQNTGTLTLTNNQSYSAGATLSGGTLDVDGTLETASVTMSAAGTTLNVDGTVQGMGGATAALTGSAGVDTINVNSGGTLRANGDLGDGVDSLNLFGTLDTGTAALNLGAGDETFTLRDGAVVAGVGIDAGTGTDQLVLDNALAMMVNGGTIAGFESLLKQNSGTATLTGNHIYANGTTIAGGTLDVDGAVVTPTVSLADNTTLNVDGSLQGAAGTAATITGTGGANTVSVNGSLLANGDLGAGNDVLDVHGTLDTGGGTLALGDGDDTFAVYDGTVVTGTIDGGAGQDSRVYDINATADVGALVNFEVLTKTGSGTLNINGPGATTLQDVNVLGGTLNVASGGSVAAALGSTLDTVVGSGATLQVDGSYGCGIGSDTMTVTGTVSGSGTIDLCDGDDTLTLNDGAVLANEISGGAGANDVLVLNSALALSFDAGNTAAFERLQKDNAGIATLTGAQSFVGGTAISGGALDVDGTLITPTVALADGTLLNVDGSVQAAGGAATLITGSTGTNIVSVGAGGSLLANGDLGNGNDVLDVAGTLDTGGGTFALGDGDDTLTIHDGTSIIGTVSAGAGNDTFNTDIATSANLGAVQGFETLSKTGAGVLNVNGPMSSDFGTVDVLAGQLNVTAGGSVTAAPGSTLTTSVASGSTLNVDGSYGCGTGNDAMTVSGTVSGSGTIDMCDGDDTLTLNDGTVLTNAISGGAGANDVLVLNNALALSFNAANTSAFERLQKDNGGTATLTGAQSFTGGTAINGGMLDVDGALTTPTMTLADNTTLNVDGSVQAGGGAATSIAGSAGVNTVSIGTGGSLLANGDLGDGNDVLDVAGTLDTVGGTFGLGDGNDTLTIHDGTNVIGTVAGGAGIDTLDADIALTADLGAVQGFETLSKTGIGLLNINGPTGSDFNTVDVLAGTLHVAATGSVAAQITTVAAGSNLQVDGNYTGTTVNDTMTVAGTVTGAGTIDLLDGDDTFTIQDGADLSGLANAVDGGAGTDTFLADIATSATLGGAVDFETLIKSNGGTLNINGPASSQFDTVLVQGGTLLVSAGASVDPQTTVVSSGATLTVNGTYNGTTDDDTFTVSGTVNGTGTIDLLDGDDTLTLNDGADLGGLSNPLDGGAHSAGDTVVLNNAAALAFNGDNIVNFETLQKNNAGTATLTGTSTFSSGVAINGGMLDVDGALEAPTVTLADDTTLNVGGSVQGVGGTAATITGSTGVNTVTVNGTLAATGDLGAGNDVLDVIGTLDTQGGTFALGDGDDSFVVHDGTNVAGTIDGGAGNDTRVYDINLTANLGALVNFEGLTKTGTGTLNINGPGTTTLQEVDVLGGTLHVGAGATVAAQDTVLANGATLGIDGNYTGTTGNDTMTVAGTVSGTGTVDLLDGDDTFTIQDGADLSGLANAVDGGAGTDTFLADIASSATLGGAVNFETLTKTNTGTLNIDGPAPSSFGTVNVVGGTLDIGAAGSIDGVVTTTVASGATLNVDGSYTGTSGNDTMDVSGTVAGTGTIDLAAGDDTLTLNDGAVLNNTIDGGGHGIGDTVVLNNANALSFDAGNTINFEFLQKDNAGTATLTGTQSFTGGTAINGGTLDVDGTLETPAVTLADDTTLNVDGSLQGVGGTTAAITGSAGANTVNVNGTVLANGDLGAGDDVLDVTGTLGTGGGTFVLGDGDDSFVVHDGTNVIGTVDGGAGLDTRVYDIDLTASLGALVNFEGVTKAGAGTLNINGPGATGLQEVSVLEGRLNIGVGASVVATAGSTLTTVVDSGATLNVDGSYGCGDGNDSMTVAGTVSGTGTIDLCGGDDTLTLNDGAVLNNTIDGGANGAGDTVVLNNANALTLDAGSTINFEFLQKDSTGTATLTGTQVFTGGTTINGGTLDVDGTLETPTVAMGDDTTLNVDGSLQGAGGTAATISGSDGVNTVTVNGTLVATGDLGAGNDVLDVVGTLDTVGGTFALGDGDDRLIVHDNTAVFGAIDAGLGNDLLQVDVGAGSLVPLGALNGFESLGKSGLGTLQINGPSSFIDVEVLGGTLDVTAGGSIAAQNTTVSNGATLNLGGNYTGTTGNDTFTVAGTVTGAGGIDLLDGDDTFTIQDGADLSGLTTPVDGGAGTDTFLADIAGSATLGGAINFETLTKTNTGTLNIDGPAPSSFSTVNVDGGTLDVGSGGSIDGVVTTTVASGATLNVDGSYTGSSGDDTMTVAGVVAGSGTVGLGDGNDTLTLQDGADTSGLQNALDGGAGTDAVSAQVASTMTLGPTVNFETLQKGGAGTLTLDGDQAYVTTNVDAGTLTVASGTALTSQNTTVASGSTLDVQGDFSGTAGNDSFTSSGTVTGALAFADGNDTVSFNGGDVSGLTGVDGGAGGSDRLSFSGLDIDSTDLAMAGWERVELLSDSSLALSNALALAGGVLAIDTTSQLDVGAGASINGSVENAGLINTGANRLAISGDYRATNAALHLTVSPGNATSGGLDVAGDVTGDTAVTFDGDGTEVLSPQEPTSILVISSPNDNLATAGGFSAANAVDGVVRVTGSVQPWTFGQHADDKNWYLEAEAAGVLPEIGGYAVLPSIGQAGIQDNNRLLFQRMDAIRGDTPRCGTSDVQSKSAYALLTGDCHGFWVAASASELEMGANPGFEFSGDNVGLYVGADLLLQDRGSRTLRGGLFAGFQRGNYWTTGVNSTELEGTGESNVQMDTPTFGMYGSINWRGGTYLDMNLTAQLPKANIVVADGFHEEIRGNSLTLSAQMGHRFQVGDGWTVEPQVQLSASAMQWGNTVDASGKELLLDDDVLGMARAAVRAEKAFETAGGARIRSWASLGLQDTLGEKESALRVAAGSEAEPFPNHALGTTATLDVGVEAELNKSVSLFGVVSYGESLDGTTSEQRQANLGVRIRW